MFCKTVQYHQKSQQSRDIGQFRLSPILVGILCLTPFPVFLPPSIAEMEFVSVIVVVAVAETKWRDLIGSFPGPLFARTRPRYLLAGVCPEGRILIDQR